MPDKLTHLSLFSGIGGLDLAAEAAGFRTAGQCEYADYPAKVLEKHWPDVPRWRDIKTLTKESFYERTGLRTVDLISGGPPCQPSSCAGQRRGKDDDRWLWPEALRIVFALRPAWAVFENPYGIVTLRNGLEFGSLLSDLEAGGYEVQAYIVPACAVGAPHRRDRVAVVANDSRDRSTAGLTDTPGGNQRHTAKPYGCAQTAANDNRVGSETRRQRLLCGRKSPLDESGGDVDDTDGGGRDRDDRRQHEPQSADGSKRLPQSGLGGVVYGLSAGLDGPVTWPPEPDIPRIAKGVKNRADRLRALGNAVVWQQFYPFFAAIAKIERMRKENLL